MVVINNMSYDQIAMLIRYTHLDLVSSVVFNTGRRDYLGYKEPFFWGAGKINTATGSVAFWIHGKPVLPAVLFEQSSAAFGRLERDLLNIELDENARLTAFLRDSRYEYHRIEAEKPINGDGWNHIVLNWDRSMGLELWLNGIDR